MPLSTQLAEKSVQAAIAVIEIYNKPNFSYREESFALLMTNAWELLLKAKWLRDRGEAIDTLYEMVKDDAGQAKPKVNRSGNAISHGLTYLAGQMVQEKNSGLQVASHQNLLALVEIRDNAAHLMNADLYIARRVQEIGTASLKNYLLLIMEWFGFDMSVYNFFLMPISFFHGFEAAEPATRDFYPDQVQKLLAYIDAREAEDTEANGEQNVALRLETHLVEGKGGTGAAIRYTDDPNAPAMTIREEDILRNYPWTYSMLVGQLKKRCTDFVANDSFQRQKKRIDQDRKLTLWRYMNPRNPETTTVQKFLQSERARRVRQTIYATKASELKVSDGSARHRRGLGSIIQLFVILIEAI